MGCVGGKNDVSNYATSIKTVFAKWCFKLQRFLKKAYNRHCTSCVKLNPARPTSFKATRQRRYGNYYFSVLPTNGRSLPLFLKS